MTEESYIIVYTMILSQNLTQKIGKKNDWRIVYNSIYYHSQSKMNKKNDSKNEVKQYIIVYTMILSQKWLKNESKNDWRIIYKTIYYDSQSKFDSKMSKKNEWRIVYNSIYYDSQSKKG